MLRGTQHNTKTKKT